MPIQGHIRAIAGALVRAKLRRQAKYFFKATRDCRRTQAKVLQSLLDLNGKSDFARSHGLDAVKTSAEFARAMPVTDYEDYRESIERLKRGDTRALLGKKNKLVMFSLSSGTTADSKFIPITNHFFHDYRRGWQIWGIRAYDAYPRLSRLKMLTLFSDYHRFTTEAGTPCGNISGLAAAMQRKAVQRLYTLPFTVAKIPDPESKYYTILRLAIADPEIGMITTANPSTLTHLAQMADQRKAELIRDIHDGTLACKDKLPVDVAAALHKRLRRADPRRAKFLESCVEKSGALLPSDMWPELQLLAVWTGGSCGAYLPGLRQAFGNLPVRDHGLSASEGRMTLPFSDESAGGVLDVTTHYFEFIPEAEYRNEHPTILPAHELQTGHNYYILLTTSSGFYRYDICDVVQCVGFEGSTPKLKFLHKGAHISNITGEKLSESQVVEAVQGTLDQFQHRVACFTLVPAWGEPPRYQLLIEGGDLPPSESLAHFERHLDQRLQELNCEYREKRETGRLSPAVVQALRDGSWREFARQRQARLGGSIEQYKHPCLLPNLEAAARVTEQFALTIS